MRAVRRRGAERRRAFCAVAQLGRQVLQPSIAIRSAPGRPWPGPPKRPRDLGPCLRLLRTFPRLYPRQPAENTMALPPCVAARPPAATTTTRRRRGDASTTSPCSRRAQPPTTQAPPTAARCGAVDQKGPGRRRLLLRMRPDRLCLPAAPACRAFHRCSRAALPHCMPAPHVCPPAHVCSTPCLSTSTGGRQDHGARRGARGAPRRRRRGRPGRRRRRRRRGRGPGRGRGRGCRRRRRRGRAAALRPGRQPGRRQRGT